MNNKCKGARNGAAIKRKAEPDILRENAPGKVYIRRVGNVKETMPSAACDGRRHCPRGAAAAYFLPGAGAEPAPEPLKYLKKSEFESITITSP
jgi:hypothetical protein